MVLSQMVIGVYLLLDLIRCVDQDQCWVMETLDLHTQWMSVIKTRSAGSLCGIETMVL